jgi:hypothetical protein
MERPKATQTKKRGGGENDPGGGSGGGWNGDGDRLLKYATELAKERDYTLARSFEQLFVKLIEDRNRIEDSIHSEDEALKNTARLMHGVIEQQESNSPQQRELTEMMLSRALKDFCPLWPFCR